MKYYLVRIAYKILNTYLNKKYEDTKDVFIIDHIKALQDILTELDCLKINK